MTITSICLRFGWDDLGMGRSWTLGNEAFVRRCGAVRLSLVLISQARAKVDTQDLYHIFPGYHLFGNIMGGVNTPPIYLKAARNLGARGVALSAQVVLPAALPAILNGLKQGWTFAWRSLMAGELIYFTLSLGNLLQTGRDLNDASQVMAVMVLIIAIGVAIDSLVFAPMERRVRERWGLVS